MNRDGLVNGLAIADQTRHQHSSRAPTGAGMYMVLDGRMIWSLAFLIVSAAASFAAGLLLPLLALEKLYFFTETPSLVQIVIGLWQGGDVLLAVLVGAFSIVFPGLKLLVIAVEALLAASGEARSAVFRQMKMVGRWSMMDVLLVALVIFAAKTSGLATAITQPGLWFFTYAVLASALAAHFAGRLRALALKRS